MSTSIEILDRVAPEFADRPEDDKRAFLNIASSMIEPSQFPGTYQQAAVFLAAHYMTLAKRGEKFEDVPGAPSGGISSMSDKGFSYSGSSAGGEDASEKALTSTQYGAEFNRLKNNNGTITTPILGP